MHAEIFLLALVAATLDPQRRAETLTIAELARLADEIHHLGVGVMVTEADSDILSGQKTESERY